jgi:energy-coupling factor transporter ATP-binding protein EcfA2
MPRIPADVPIPVVFAATNEAAARVDAPFVVAIVPDPDAWNDYRRGYFAFIRVISQGPDGLRPLVFDQPVRFMFEAHRRTATRLRELFAEHGEVIPVERIDDLFCSLLSRATHYRDLVRLLGFAPAVSALRKLGDAVIVQLEGEDERRQALIDGEDFHIGMMRNEATFQALRRGGRYLRPNPAPDVEDAARSFTLAAQLPSAENRYVIDFDFRPDPLFRDRVAVLIGKNGAGKTQLLRALIEAMIDTEVDGAPIQNRPGALMPRPEVSRLLVFSSVTSDPYPDKIEPWRGVDYQYFGMTAHKEAGRDAVLLGLSECMRAPFDFRVQIDGRGLTRMALLGYAMERLGFDRRIWIPVVAPRPGEDQLGGLMQAPDGLYAPLQVRYAELAGIQLVARMDWSRQAIIMNDRMAPRRLSSGELAMFRFAVQAVSAIEHGSLLILDEPETHLHANYVSEFMSLLQDLLGATASAAIIATHSAYVVREAPRQRVRVLTLAEGQITVETPRMQTFGASLDKISEFVFGDTNRHHRFQRLLERWVEAEGRALGLQEIVERYRDALNPETMAYIAELLRHPPGGAGDLPGEAP